MANIVKTGGNNTKLNVFCQPNAPKTKQGIWLKTNEYVSFKKVVFDTSVWAGEQWVIPSPVKNMSSTDSTREAGCLTVNNQIYLCGGYRRTSEYVTTAYINVYHPETNTYGSAGYMNYERRRPGCVAINNTIYIFGGSRDSSHSRNEAEKYEVASGLNKNIASMSKNRSDPGCTAVENNIYIFGGHTLNSRDTTPRDDAEIYNTNTNTYSSAPRMPETVKRPHCITFGNKIYIYGSPFIYDTETQTYSTGLNNVPISSDDAGCVLVGDTVYCIGYQKAYACNIPTNTVREIQSRPKTSYQSCCAYAANGLYVFGGWDEDVKNARVTVDFMTFTSKQYNDDPTVVVHYFPKDTSHSTSLMENHQMSWHPTYFKDAMLYINGKVTFPAVYCGDGENWNLIREEQ